MRKSLFFLALLAFSAVSRADGPTPYPDPKDEAAWPGEGPIRCFPWMVDNRKAFWNQRDRDQGAVVFVGDSLTAGWKPELLAEKFPIGCVRSSRRGSFSAGRSCSLGYAPIPFADRFSGR